MSLFKNLEPLSNSKHLTGTRWILLAIVLTALVLRAGLSLYKPPILLDVMVARQTALVERTGISASTIEDLKENKLLQSDAQVYHILASNLVAGRGYTDAREAPFAPTRIRTPGYPSFIALVYLLFGTDHRVLLVAQSVLGALSAYFVFLLGARLFDSRAGLLGAAMVALYPALIYYDTRVLREGLAASVLTLTVLLAVYNNQNRKPFPLLITGALLTLLSLSKPEFILLYAPVVFLLVRPLRNLRAILKPALLVALPIVVVWSAWTARNYTTFGSLSPVTVGLGSTIWFGSRWAEIGGEDRKQKDYLHLNVKTRDRIRDIRSSSDESKIEKTFMQLLLKDLADKPGWFASMVLKKGYLFWKDANGTKKMLPAIHPTAATLVNLYYYLLLGLAITALALSAKSREWVLPVASVIGTFMITYALLHVRNRYRVPVLPLTLLLSAGGFWILFDLVKASIPVRAPATYLNGRVPHAIHNSSAGVHQTSRRTGE
ncbi:MAG: hypothetical protein CME25_10760 [Gemmatimonadetes bacterium]|nr:hypothetical protein [Gemmatimonadota bacterium]